MTDIYASSAPGLAGSERFTGLTGLVIGLAKAPLLNPNSAIPTPFRVSKNGLLLDPAGGAGGYTVAGNSVTLGTAAISGDVFVIDYWYQAY
jgi:hypothetical protein